MFQNSIIYYPPTMFLSHSLTVSQQNLSAPVTNSRRVFFFFLKQPVQHTELSRVQQKAIV